MRLLPMLIALPVLALQAHAQTPLTQHVAPAPVVAAAPVPDATTQAAEPHRRTTWQQHFAQANLAHDGHLTLQEANGGYPTVAHHFKEIDADKKGYVTEEDVTNWHKLQRAMRHPASGRADDGLRPRPAIQRTLTVPEAVNTSADDKLLPMTQPDALSAGK